MSPDNWNRREFIKTSGIAAGMTVAGLPFSSPATVSLNRPKKITIAGTGSNFEREPLIRSLGFKGGYMSEIWQTAALLRSDSGTEKIGLCSQSILWSDSKVFGSFSEAAGNSLMFAMTDYALRIIKGTTFENPVKLLEDILEDVHSYGKKITDNPGLR
jgi:hypothetical protein